MLIQGIGGRYLHQLAEVHHPDARRNMAHHRQIVGDKQIGQPQLLLQILKDVHHLRLHRNIQRRQRLIAQDKLRAHRQRPGNADPLALAAAELVREALKMFLLEPHLVEQGFGSLPLLLAAVAVDLHRLRHQLLDGHPGIQRRIRILENGLHPLTQRLELLFAGLGDRLPGKINLAGGDIKQPQNGAPEGRFAAAGFAHQAKGLPLADIKADAVHRFHHHPFAQQTAVESEVLMQVPHADQRGILFAHA